MASKSLLNGLLRAGEHAWLQFERRLAGDARAFARLEGLLAGGASDGRVPARNVLSPPPPRSAAPPQPATLSRQGTPPQPARMPTAQTRTAAVAPSARPVRWAPEAVSLLLLSAIALQLGSIRRDVQPLRLSAPARAPHALRRNMIDEILHGHLFGLAEGGEGSGAGLSNLLLSGVIALGDPGHGLAIVAADGGSAHVYSVGGEIPGGLKLLEVYADHVVVGRSGIKWQLMLPRRFGLSQLLAATATEPELDAPLAAAETADQPDFQARALLSALPPASGVARTLRPEAVVAGGQLHGYQVYPVDPEKLGLRSGDELVAINDQELKDPQQAAHIMESLDSTNATTVKLTLTHLGVPYDLVVSADALRWHRR